MRKWAKAQWKGYGSASTCRWVFLASRAGIQLDELFLDQRNGELAIKFAGDEEGIRVAVEPTVIDGGVHAGLGGCKDEGLGFGVVLIFASLNEGELQGESGIFEGDIGIASIRTPVAGGEVEELLEVFVGGGGVDFWSDVVVGEGARPARLVGLVLKGERGGFAFGDDESACGKDAGVDDLGAAPFGDVGRDGGEQAGTDTIDVGGVFVAREDLIVGSAAKGEGGGGLGDVPGDFEKGFVEAVGFEVGGGVADELADLLDVQTVEQLGDAFVIGGLGFAESFEHPLSADFIHEDFAVVDALDAQAEDGGGVEAGELLVAQVVGLQTPEVVGFVGGLVVVGSVIDLSANGLGGIGIGLKGDFFRLGIVGGGDADDERGEGGVAGFRGVGLRRRRLEIEDGTEDGIDAFVAGAGAQRFDEVPGAGGRVALEFHGTGRGVEREGEDVVGFDTKESLVAPFGGVDREEVAEGAAGQVQGLGLGVRVGGGVDGAFNGGGGTETKRGEGFTFVVFDGEEWGRIVEAAVAEIAATEVFALEGLKPFEVGGGFEEGFDFVGVGVVFDGLLDQPSGGSALEGDLVLAGVHFDLKCFVGLEAEGADLALEFFLGAGGFVFHSDDEDQQPGDEDEKQKGGGQTHG